MFSLYPILLHFKDILKRFHIILKSFNAILYVRIVSESLLCCINNFKSLAGLDELLKRLCSVRMVIEFIEALGKVVLEVIGASRKNNPSCLKYATNCGFLPILKKEKLRSH